MALRLRSFVFLFLKDFSSKDNYGLEIKDFHTQILAVMYIVLESQFHQHQSNMKSSFFHPPQFPNCQMPCLRNYLFPEMLYCLFTLCYPAQLFHLYWNTECPVSPLDLVNQNHLLSAKVNLKNSMTQPQRSLPVLSPSSAPG